MKISPRTIIPGFFLASLICLSLLINACNPAVPSAQPGNQPTAQPQSQTAEGGRPAYDLLVRPSSGISDIERKLGLVSPNALTGIGGGITTEQWQQILSIPDVEVAAPLALLGYIPRGEINIGLRGIHQNGIYRVTTTVNIFNGVGTQSVSRQRSYYGWLTQEMHGLSEEQDKAIDQHFSRLGLVYLGDPTFRGLLIDAPALGDKLLLAAIDPEQENLLTGLEERLVSTGTRDGKYLQSASPFEFDSENETLPSIPALVNIQDTISQTLSIRVERTNVISTRGAQMKSLFAIPDRETIEAAEHTLVWEKTIPIERRDINIWPNVMLQGEQIYPDTVIGPPSILGPLYPPVPVQYEVMADPPPALPEDLLVFEAVSTGLADTEQTWYYENFLAADGSDRWADLRWQQPPQALYRDLQPGMETEIYFKPDVLGYYEAPIVPPLSTDEAPPVPQDPYLPAGISLVFDEEGNPIEPAADLLPTPNDGGYLVAPADLLIPLDQVPHLYQNGCIVWEEIISERYTVQKPVPVECSSVRQDLISAIRVKVWGVTGTDEQSLERVRQVAQEIIDLTGLHVDILLGAAPQPVLVHLPGYGDAPGQGFVQEIWLKPQIAVDRP